MTIYKPADSDRPDAYWEKNRDIAIRTVMEEDFPLGERMQIGFESGAAEEVIYGRNEPSLVHFTRRSATRSASLLDASERRGLLCNAHQAAVPRRPGRQPAAQRAGQGGAHQARSTGEITPAELKAVEDAEISKLVARQESIGLQAVTDGEFRRSWWHYDFLSQLDGVELVSVAQGLQFKGTQTKAEGLHVHGKIDFSPRIP